ncbi:MAG: HD domain-containing protein [Patescibacteria group bacterium]
MQKIIAKCEAILDKAFRESDELAGGVNYRYIHGVRTMMACKKILSTPELKGKEIRKLELFVAALFHDIGKVVHIEEDGTLQGDRSKDQESHEEIGARIVGDYLKGVIPDESIQFVSKIIRESQNPKLVLTETKILNDADVLDSIGLINVWRMFTYSGKKGRSIQDTLAYYSDIIKDPSRKENLYFSYTKKVTDLRRKRLEKFIEDFRGEYDYKDLTQ